VYSVDSADPFSGQGFDFFPDMPTQHPGVTNRSSTPSPAARDAETAAAATADGRRRSSAKTFSSNARAVAKRASADGEGDDDDDADAIDLTDSAQTSATTVRAAAAAAIKSSNSAKKPSVSPGLAVASSPQYAHDDLPATLEADPEPSVPMAAVHPRAHTAATPAASASLQRAHSSTGRVSRSSSSRGAAAQNAHPVDDSAATLEDDTVFQKPSPSHSLATQNNLSTAARTPSKPNARSAPALSDRVPETPDSQLAVTSHRKQQSGTPAETQVSPGSQLSAHISNTRQAHSSSSATAALVHDSFSQSASLTPSDSQEVSLLLASTPTTPHVPKPVTKPWDVLPSTSDRAPHAKTTPSGVVAEPPEVIAESPTLNSRSRPRLAAATRHVDKPAIVTPAASPASQLASPPPPARQGAGRAVSVSSLLPNEAAAPAIKTKPASKSKSTAVSPSIDDVFAAPAPPHDGELSDEDQAKPVDAASTATRTSHRVKFLSGAKLQDVHVFERAPSISVSILSYDYTPLVDL